MRYRFFNFAKSSPRGNQRGAISALTDQAVVESSKCDRCALGSKWLFCLLFSWGSLFALAQITTNSDADEIPPLRPPRAEIPPGLWERHSGAFIGVSLIVLLAIGILLWVMFRVRPRATIPPAVQARHALGSLAGQPENGVLLSRVSQTLRRYIMAAFGLKPGELTTTEFCRVISSNSSVGERLSSEIALFLRSCDERKFAPVAEPAPLNAVAIALRFVEESEQRCAELRKAEQAAQTSPTNVSKSGKTPS